MSTPENTAAGRPRYKRKLRNYLIDVGLQLRYTVFIILVAVFLTGVLGYKIFDATQETSKIILMNGLLDPSTVGELQGQFQGSDRTVLLSIIGFGLVLVFSIAGAGIWITHKVAGPLYSMANVCRRVRSNHLSMELRHLRKGDELQEFHSAFREMYEALRVRAGEDISALSQAITALDAIEPKTQAARETLEMLRKLRAEKESSLVEAPKPAAAPAAS